MRIARNSIRVLLAATFFAAFPALADDNPHWNKGACQTCHVDTAPAAGSLVFQGGDPEALCESCHGDRGNALKCRHSSGLEPDQIAIPESHTGSLKEGKVVCTTCHDLVFQCNNPQIAYSFQNPGFLRNRVSHATADQCFECHDDQRYPALNPHTGTVGDPPRRTCLLCHERPPQTTPTGGIDISFNMERDLNDICRGCHNVQPHPRGMSFGAQAEGWVHLVKPSVAVLGKMERWQAATGGILPLSSYGGQIHCATCHNPHGFLTGPIAAQPKYRLRADDICQVCHDK